MRKIFSFINCTSLIAIILVFFTSEFLFGQVEYDSSKYLIHLSEFFDTEGVILPADSTSLKRIRPYNLKQFTPGIEEVTSAEEIFKHLLIMLNGNYVKGKEDAIKKIKSYYRQYKG